MKLDQLSRRARNKFVAAAMPRMLRPRTRADMVRLGSDYGGWWVPASMLGGESRCLLAGAGLDITFDLALMERFGCDVISVDPTPRAIAHVEGCDTGPGYHFLPVGLAAVDGTAGFSAPNNPRHVSHSMTDLQGTGNVAFTAPVRSVGSLMTEFGFDGLDLVKIDIEGAEYQVLESLLDDGVLPRVLCVEFDQPVPFAKPLKMVQRLRAVGYVVVQAEHFNVVLVRE